MWSLYSCCSHLEHRASVKHFVSLQFLNLRQSVRLFGREISATQGRYLYTTTQTQNKRRQISMPWMGFEPTIPVFERAKIFHARPRGRCDLQSEAGATLTEYTHKYRSGLLQQEPHQNVHPRSEKSRFPEWPVPLCLRHSVTLITSTPIMERACSSEMLVFTYKITRRHKADHNLSMHSRETWKSV
jgi:hypothetical protein